MTKDERRQLHYLLWKLQGDIDDPNFPQDEWRSLIRASNLIMQYISMQDDDS